MQSIDSLRELNSKLLAEIAELRKENVEIPELREKLLKFAEVEAENARLLKRMQGQRVVTQGTKMGFPLPLTQARRRNSHGKFQKPPNLSPGAKPSEDDIQEYFIDECSALKALPETKLYVGDTHSTPLLNTRKPDFLSF